MTRATASADSVELVTAFDDFRRTFETFRSENDRRIDEMGRKMAADVLTTEKVDRINQALDEQKRLVDTLVLKGRRPALGEGGLSPLAASEHKTAFDAYVRRGNEDALRTFEQKALAVSTNAGADARGDRTTLKASFISRSAGTRAVAKHRAQYRRRRRRISQQRRN